MTDYIVPILLLLICSIALGRRESAYDIMLSGAKDGLSILLSIVPALI